MTGQGESKPGTAALQKPGGFQQEVRELGPETRPLALVMRSGGDASETSLGGS